MKGLTLRGAIPEGAGPPACMPRLPRQEVADGIFHVYARGNDRRDLFLDELDRTRYLRLLQRAVQHCRWRLLSYCLMPNHVHLLVETPEANLGKGMQQVHAPYAQAFNRKHGRCGHVFQGRYGAVRVTDDPQLITVVRYIARNPVTAGLADEPARWLWSSHRAIAGLTARPDWLATPRLLELLSGWTLDPLEAYATLTCRAGSDPS